MMEKIIILNRIHACIQNCLNLGFLGFIKIYKLFLLNKQKIPLCTHSKHVSFNVKHRLRQFKYLTIVLGRVSAVKSAIRQEIKRLYFTHI